MLPERLKRILGYEEIKAKNLWKALLAEFLGTLFLVLIGCGSCIKWDPEGLHIDHTVKISLAFGLTVAAAVQCIAHVSGGHINPAVSFGMLVAGKISIIRFLFYVVTQCIGAVIGAALLKVVTPQSLRGNLGLSMVNKPQIDDAQAFSIELLITFLLVFIVFSVCDENRGDIKGSAPLAIGLAVSTCHLFAVIKYRIQHESCANFWSSSDDE